MLLPFATMDAGPDDGASLDQTGISTADSGVQEGRAQQKVELDLDDAPFLEDDDEPLPMADTVPLQAGPEEPVEEEPAEAKPNRKKLIIIAAAVAAVLLIGIPTYMWVIPDVDVQEQESATTQELAPQDQPEPAPEPEEPPKPEIVIRLKPFWVEKPDPQGVVHFLNLSFAFSTIAPDLEKEINVKAPLLRDAVYYYLHNKPYEFLADTANINAVKADLVSVINQYIGNDQLQTVYIETYLMK